MAYTDTSFFVKLKPYVINDMRKTGILASLTAAQAFIESNKGNSGLTVQCNNLFGIKGQYNGQSKKFWTTEYYNGVKTRIQADFRKYPSWAESIADHSGLFNRLARYKNLRNCKSYREACINVQNDEYATSPTYAQTLINTIEKYKLYLWDAEAAGSGTYTPDISSSTINDTPTLRKGDKNDYVLHWQKFLNQSGFFCGNEDGIFGKNTELAVKQYQMSKGLKADGIIGPKTWNMVGK